MDETRPDNIDKLLKDSLQSSQRKPSKEVWENIEHELNEDDRRASIVRFRFIYLISACLLLLVGGFWFRSEQRHGNIIAHPDNSGPAPAESSISKGTNPPSGLVRNDSVVLGHFATQAHTNGNPGKRPHSGETTHASDKKLAQSGEAFLDMRNFRPGMIEEPRSTIRSALVSLQRVTLTPHPQQPDPNQRLLTDHLSRFKKSNLGISPHRPTHWSVTGYFSKEFAGYNLSDHDSIAANGREVDKKERPVYSVSPVVVVNYNLKGKWVFQSGLGYSRSKSIANPTTSYAVNNNGQIKFQVNTVSGYGYLPVSPSTATQVGDSVITGNSFTKLRYLTVPFIASYKFRIRRLTIMAGMGFTLNFLTSATLETKLRGASYSEDEVVVRMHGLKAIYYGTLMKAEIQYPIYKGWSLDLVTSFKNTLTPINLHTVISTYSYNLGIGLGISHTF